MKRKYYIYDNDLAIGDTDEITFRQVIPKDDIPLLHLSCKVDWTTKTVHISPMFGVGDIKELFTPDTEFEDCIPPEDLAVYLRWLAIDLCYVFSPGQGTIEVECNRAISDFLSEKASLEIVREDHANGPMIAFYLKIEDFTTRALFEPKDLELWLEVELLPYEKIAKAAMDEIENDFRNQRGKL